MGFNTIGYVLVIGQAPFSFVCVKAIGTFEGQFGTITGQKQAVRVWQAVRRVLGGTINAAEAGCESVVGRDECTLHHRRIVKEHEWHDARQLHHGFPSQKGS